MKKSFRIVTVFLAVMLVLGLVVSACAAPTTPPTTPPPTTTPTTTPPPTTPPPTTPPPTTPPTTGGKQLTPPATLSFEAATYTNAEYGFSFEYPKDWVERPDMLTTPHHVVAFSVSAFVPGIVVIQFDADAPESADWIKSSVGLIGGQSPKVLTDITPVTTQDGSTGYMYQLGYISSSGYQAQGLCLDVDRGAKRIRFMVFTVTEFEPFNETLYEEILSTVKFQ